MSDFLENNFRYAVSRSTSFPESLSLFATTCNGSCEQENRKSKLRPKSDVSRETEGNAPWLQVTSLKLKRRRVFQVLYLGRRAGAIRLEIPSKT